MALAPLAASTRFFGRFLGRTIGEAAAFSAGVAIGPVLGPIVQEERNAVNAKYPFHPLGANDAAGIVAEHVELEDWGITEASYTGVDEERFRALYGEALNAPGIALLFEQWRRNLISTADFEHGLRKAKLEPRWDAPLQGLHDTLLSSEELAMLQQQGFVDEGRANSEGELQGVTNERQQLRFEASGLPPGIAEALQMLRRQIIDEGTFAQIVREGHTKTKYTDELLELRDVVLNANDYVTNVLRGWSEPPAMYAGGELTGHTREQMDLLFQNHGRPPSWHQIWIGLQRGGTFDGPTADIHPAFLKGLRESDIRPEWYNLLWHSRYNYPSAFVLRNLTQRGDISEADALEILRFEGWEPTLAAKVARAWGTTASAAQKEATAAELLTLWDGNKLTTPELQAALAELGYPADEAQRKMDLVEARRVASATTSAIGDLHTAYKKGDLSNASVLAALGALGVSTDGAADIVAAWQAYLTAAGIAAPP